MQRRSDQKTIVLYALNHALPHGHAEFILTKIFRYSFRVLLLWLTYVTVTVL